MGKIFKVQKPGLVTKNYSSFLSILSKKERIKTIIYVFKRKHTLQSIHKILESKKMIAIMPYHL
jgi:hypothetical protein